MFKLEGKTIVRIGDTVGKAISSYVCLDDSELEAGNYVIIALDDENGMLVETEGRIDEVLEYNN